MIPTTQTASTDAYLFLTQTVDEETCNPLKAWHDMGEPANPTKDQIDLLQQAARPQIRTERIAPVSTPESQQSQQPQQLSRQSSRQSLQESQQPQISIDLNIKENGIVYFSLEPKPMQSDRGYSYERVMQYERR